MNEMQASLEQGNVTPIMRLVKEDTEREIRDLFKKTLIATNRSTLSILVRQNDTP